DPFRGVVDTAKVSIPLVARKAAEQLQWPEALVADPHARSQFYREGSITQPEFLRFGYLLAALVGGVVVVYAFGFVIFENPLDAASAARAMNGTVAGSPVSL
ncbi:hypothetical protein, partial [uncultured Caulobacter sp.]|uniref:hypothetical protein n=1 Tax=uncultured Caulobacter sp. TaxID=158749 RepID=UPI002624E192